MKKFILCSMMLALTFYVATAQNATDANISGHVIDATTGAHIPYVQIQLKNTNIGTITDETGHYFFTNLPVGKAILVFSMLGYETTEKSIEIKASTTQELNVTLTESAILIGDVVVSANKYATKQKETANIVNVLSPVTFEATASNCVAEVLNFQPGLQVEMTCQNCGVPQLRINGLEGQYSQILMDNRPIFSSLASVYGLEQIPIGMVDRIEVVRGGGSALFGANAIGGVVNIITKEPTKNFVNLSNNTTLIGGKSFDINTALNGSFVTKDSKMGIFLFGVQRDRQSYDHNGDGFTEIPKLNSTTVGFRSFYKIGMYSKITAEYHHLHEFRRGGNKLHRPPHEAEIAEQLKHNIDAGSLKFDYFSPDSRHFLSLYGSAQHIARESYFGAGQDPNAYGESRDIVAVGGGQYRLSWMQKTWLPADFSAGIEYSYNHLHDQILGYNRNLVQKIHLYGGYLQNEWKNETLSLLVGTRLEKHSLVKKPVFTPRVNVRYTPIENVILRVSYASGYRAPQTYEEDLHVGAVGGNVSLISIDENLRPEYSHSLSGSADLYKKWGRWETNLTMEGFFTQLNDVFVLKENGHDNSGNLLLTRTNSLGARVAGLNLEGKVVFRQFLSLQVGYTYQKSRYIEAITWSSNSDIAPQKRMFRTPDNYGYAIVSSEPFRGFNISVSGKYTGNMLVQHFAGYIPEDEEVTTKSFWDLGVKLAYEIPLYKFYTLEINGGVKNILNSFQPDLDQGEHRDAGYIYGPILPRSYFFGINLKI